MDNKKNKKPHINKIIEQVNSINVNKKTGNVNINSMNEVIDNFNNENGTNIPKVRNTHVDEKDLFEPIGILDPEGLRDNPLTGEPYKDIYFNATKEPSEHNVSYKFLSKIWSGFPMYEKRVESIKAIYENQVVLIVSGTGSGKTVLTPKFVLHTLNYQGRIAITNPKRFPSKENAIYAAKTLDVKLGKEVGLKYRGSDSSLYSAKDSKLLYCTDGFILAKLQSDPMLSDFDCIVIDEAHERGVQIDLLLMLVKELIKRRPTFKLIIMSATVNEKIFVDYFPKNEFKFGFVNAGEVPLFHIDESYLDKPINQFDDNGNLINDAFIEAAADRAVKILKETEEGDILIFVSGKGEAPEGCKLIHRKMEQVNKNLDNKIYCDVLTAATDKETQDLLKNDKKYKESGKYTRKVIIATEVAESSITFKGLDYVIDSGLVNENVYYSAKNMVSLEKKYISKASHKQRRGRVGRKRPGFCYNLFTKEEFEKKFPDYAKAPILIDDISPQLQFFLSKKYLVNHINYPFTYGEENKKNNKKENKKNNKKENGKQKGGENVITNIEKNSSSLDLAQFLSKLIEKPPVDNVKRALERIEALGGIVVKEKVGVMTDLGRAMAVFDVIPEIGRILIAGYNYHCRDEMVDLAAMFEISEMRLDAIFERFSTKIKDEAEKKKEKAKYEKIKKKWASSLGDHFSLLNIYADFFERRYDTVDRRTGRIIKEKRGDARQWCKENYLNYNKLEKVRNTSKDINRKFAKVIQIFHEKHPNEKPTHLFMPTPPQISSKKEENITRALMEGFYINLMKKTSDRKYTNCFPPHKTTSGLDQASLYAIVKAPTKYAIYTQLKSIFGRPGYGIVSKVPPNYVDALKNSPAGKKMADCWVKMDAEKMQQHKKGKSGKSGKKSGKKSKFSRRR